MISSSEWDCSFDFKIQNPKSNPKSNPKPSLRPVSSPITISIPTPVIRMNGQPQNCPNFWALGPIHELFARKWVLLSTTTRDRVAYLIFCIICVIAFSAWATHGDINNPELVTLRGFVLVVFEMSFWMFRFPSEFWQHIEQILVVYAYSLALSSYKHQKRRKLTSRSSPPTPNHNENHGTVNDLITTLREAITDLREATTAANSHQCQPADHSPCQQTIADLRMCLETHAARGHAQDRLIAVLRQQVAEGKRREEEWEREAEVGRKETELVRRDAERAQEEDNDKRLWQDLYVHFARMEEITSAKTPAGDACRREESP